MANNPTKAARTFEARIGEWVVAARWPVIAGTLILVAAAAAGSLLLNFSASYRVFFSPDDPQLLARDAGVSAVSVTVELPAEEEVVLIPEVARFAHSLAAQVRDRFSGIDVRLVGTVIINNAFTEASFDSQKTFLPASLAIMALVLIVLTRGFAGVAATGLVIVFSVLVSMGLGGWVGLPFTPPTAPAPTIVLMVAVANCAHLLVVTLRRLRPAIPNPRRLPRQSG